MLKAQLIIPVLLAGGVLVAAAAELRRPDTTRRADVAALPLMPSDTATARIAITGMTCGTCATTARVALERVPGVYRAVVSYDSASAVVRYDPALTRPEVFMAELQRLTGYRATLVSDASAATRRPPGT